jgi:hypothetical protein
MSSLCTYARANTFKKVEPTEAGAALAPGTFVTLRQVVGGASGFGTVVSADAVSITVLWSSEPAKGPNFQFPNVKKVQMGLIAQNVIDIQPMTGPSAKVFFMDWDYASGSKGAP